MSLKQWIQQRICGLRGHVDSPVFEYGHFAMRCVFCGYQSKGWRWSVRNARAACAWPRVRGRFFFGS